MKIVIAALAVAGLVLGVSAPAEAARPSIPDVQIVYEYQTPTEPPTPYTFAVVNFTADDYWLCVTFTRDGFKFLSAPFFLDEFAEPGHERTEVITVDPRSTITLYAATEQGCLLKQKWDVFRVPR